MSSLFKNRKLVIATMHQKDLLMQPLLEKELGVECVLAPTLNTDKFGTFTRDIKRSGDMYETAKAKLSTAMKLSGCDLGVASEGSFGLHPSIPFVQSNFELILFIDTKNHLEIRGHHRTLETNLDGMYVSSVEQGLRFANKCGFPEHGVITRRTRTSKLFLDKSIQTEEELKASLRKILRLPFTSKAYIETDMRAHKNPTRMKAIGATTKDLIQNIHSKCPQCQTAGFVLKSVEKGLPCEYCGKASNLPLFEIFSCDACSHEEKKKSNKYGEFADPGQCSTCNP